MLCHHVTRCVCKVVPSFIFTSVSQSLAFEPAHDILYPLFVQVTSRTMILWLHPSAVFTGHGAHQEVRPQCVIREPCMESDVCMCQYIGGEIFPYWVCYRKQQHALQAVHHTLTLIIMHVWCIITGYVYCCLVLLTESEFLPCLLCITSCVRHRKFQNR